MTCLRGFTGAVLLVSHDQHVIRSLAKEVRTPSAKEKHGSRRVWEGFA